MPKRHRKTRLEKIDEEEKGKNVPLTEFAEKKKDEIELHEKKEEKPMKIELKESKPEYKIKLVPRKEEQHT